jgi:putative ABC transport system substrate-binding protein
MDWRAFVGCAFAMYAAAIVPTARAQSAEGLPLVVLISTGTEALSGWQAGSLLAGLRKVGQVPGQTIRFKMRYADGDTTRYPALLEASIAERPAVIVVVGLIAARDARNATKTIPIVVATGSDLVEGGVVQSFARPGGNITGISDLTDEYAAKRLDLLKAALPGAKRVALLIDTEFPAIPKVEARVGGTARSFLIRADRVIQ